MQTSPAGAGSDNAVVSADDPSRRHVSDNGGAEECAEHLRRRSVVTAGKRRQPAKRDLEPKATVRALPGRSGSGRRVQRPVRGCPRVVGGSKRNVLASPDRHHLKTTSNC
jgi:hypothetical protein